MNPTHDEFHIERVLNASRERVWAAWADPALKRRWFVDSDSPAWSERAYSVDFRVGGRESGSFELTEGPGQGVHENATHYLDIVDGRRIAFAYTMAMDGRIHSASLSTVTFEDQGDGTRMVYTEQGAFFEDSDGPAMRRDGWEHLMNALEKTLTDGESR